MPSVAENVLFIQEGACNPRAMARELVRAIDEACDCGGVPAAGESPEIRLILHQLLWILYGIDVGVHDYMPKCGVSILRKGLRGKGWDWDHDMAAVRKKVEDEKAAAAAAGLGEPKEA